MRNKLLIYSKKMLILVLALHLTSNLVKSQTIKGSWTSITNMPTARWFPGTTVYNDKIYIIGGNASASTASMSVVEVYNPATDTWETKTPIPTPRSQVSAVTVNGKIYVIGGSSGPSDWIPVPEVYIYDPASDTWSTGTNMPGPRTEMSLVAVQDKIYAIGGITGASAGSKSVDIYTPATNTWSKGADMPTARGTMPACELDGKIYVFGGSNGGVSGWNHYATLEVYNIATNSWSTKADMPFSRSHMAGCTLNNKIFALGGTQVDNNSSYANMASYNPKTNTWESEPSMIKAREAFKAVVVNGKIYAIGGTQVQTGLVAFSNAEVYDTVPKVFISNPELRLPSKQASLIGKLYVPNSGSLKFTYQINNTLYDGALFKTLNDSVVTAQSFALNSNKAYQFEVLAVSENNDSVKTVIKLSAVFNVNATFTAPNGFLLQSADKKVMIDVLASKSPGLGFIANSDTIWKRMKSGLDPFNNVDLIYTSHSHACHFDSALLYHSMINNPKAIAIMNQDVKKIMVPYFTSHPELLDRVFAPDIAVNSYVDTTLAGIKIRITNYAHGSGSAFGINIMLDSISFVHFDEYNKLSVDDYKTIGFTQLPTDVALLGSTLLNGDQQMIKNTYNTSGLLTFSHIENYTTTLYDTLTKHAAKLNALGYQTSILVWPMQMFSYKKTNKGMGLITLNSAPKLNRSILYLNVEKNKTSVVSIKNTFIDADLNDKLRYSFTINDLPLPEWAKFDSLKQELTLTPTEVKTYTLTITATDNHLCFANTSFLLKVTEPEAIENMRENSKFKVYPNPAKSVINIESPGDQKSSYSVNLYNMLGEKVYSGYECKNNKLTIDLSKFSESVMFLTITSNGTIECHKIIKH